jgi:hypothetical protein
MKVNHWPRAARHAKENSISRFQGLQGSTRRLKRLVFAVAAAAAIIVGGPALSASAATSPRPPAATKAPLAHSLPATTIKVPGIRVAIGRRSRSGQIAPSDIFFCEYDGAEVSALPFYDTTSPYPLDFVVFSGSDTALCGGTIASISDTISVIDPSGNEDIVAEGSYLACDLVDTAPTGYACTSGVQCAGDWQATETVEFVVPPDDVFLQSSPQCIIGGDMMTCFSTFDIGTIAPYNS